MVKLLIYGQQDIPIIIADDRLSSRRSYTHAYRSLAWRISRVYRVSYICLAVEPVLRSRDVPIVRWRGIVVKKKSWKRKRNFKKKSKIIRCQWYDSNAATTSVLSDTSYTVCATSTVVLSLLNRLPRTDRRWRRWRVGPNSPPVSLPPPPPPPTTDRSLPPPADRRTRPIVTERRRIVTLSRRVNTCSVHIIITLNRQKYAVGTMCRPRRGRRQKTEFLCTSSNSPPATEDQSCSFPPYVLKEKKKVRYKRFCYCWFYVIVCGCATIRKK